MATARYDFQKLERAAGAFLQIQRQCDSTLTNDKNLISNLVGPGGGLRTPESGPELDRVFGEYVRDATRFLESLNKAATFLRNVIQQQRGLEGQSRSDFSNLRR
jgi:hypothetical protein